MGFPHFPARLSIVAMLFSGLLAGAPLRADDTEASRTIDALHGILIEIMKEADELGFPGRFARVDPVVEATFDLEFMAAKTLGPHAKKLDAAERERWVETFRHFVTSNFARQFDGYSGQHFETVGVDSAPHGTVIVRTRLVRMNEEDVKLHYRLREAEVASVPLEADGSEAGQGEGAEAQPPPLEGARWRVIDIYSNGTVSELALRRSEFSSLLKRQGFEGLIEAVESKAAKE